MSQTRSPLKHPAQRLPGQSLREQSVDVVFERFGSEMIAVFMGVYAMMEWMRWALRTVPGWRSCTLYTAIALFCVARMLRHRRRSDQQISNLQQGLEGEIAVGQFLDEYCRQRGYAVIHDLKAEGFNVDHILIGSGGVFAIETKTRSKPLTRRPVVSYDGESVLVDGYMPDRDPIAEAKGCARHVAELIEQTTSRKVRVRPVVLYPGWFIEGSSSGREVWVLNPKSLPAFLDHEPQHLTEEDARLIATHVKTFNRRDHAR